MDLRVSMLIKTTVVYTCLFIFVVAPQLVTAHAPIKERISELNKQLEQDPNNIELYLARGELFRIHKEWSASEADFKRVIKLDQEDIEVHLYLGRMFLSSGRLRKAESELKHYLEYMPGNNLARVELAQILLALDRRLDAIKEYTRAINSHPQPSQDWYLQRAKALSEGGDPYLEEALNGLDQGIQRLGPLVSLQLYAISLELKKGLYNEALVRLDQVAAQSSRKETWLVRRAEILAKAGRNDKAMDALNNALTALHSLPQHRRNTKAMLKLEISILELLEHLKSKGQEKN